MHAVPYGARAVIVRVARQQDRPGHRLAKLLYCRFFKFDLGAVERYRRETGVCVGGDRSFALAAG